MKPLHFPLHYKSGVNQTSGVDDMSVGSFSQVMYKMNETKYSGFTTSNRLPASTYSETGPGNNEPITHNIPAILNETYRIVKYDGSTDYIEFGGLYKDAGTGSTLPGKHTFHVSAAAGEFRRVKTVVIKYKENLSRTIRFY